MHISASDPALCNLAIFAQPHEKVSEGVCKVHLKLFKFDCMSLREAAARVYDTDLSDDAWALIEPMLPVPRFGGRPRTTNVRAVLNAILYLLRTGCQWRLLPREFGLGHGVSLLSELGQCRGLDVCPANSLQDDENSSRSKCLSIGCHHG